VHRLYFNTFFSIFSAPAAETQQPQKAAAPPVQKEIIGE
jgi:hypothetical protein